MMKSFVAVAGIMGMTVAASATGAVLINQDFENQTTFPSGTSINVGSPVGNISTTAGLWQTRDANGTPNPTPSVDPDDSSNHAVLITRQAGARPTFSGARDITISDSLFLYEFSFRLNGATHVGGNQIDFIATLGRASDGVVAVNPTAIYLGANDFRYHSGAFTTVAGVTITPEQWHHVQVRVDATTPSAGTMSVILDGNTILSNASVGSLVGLADAFDRITFIAQETQGRSFYVDDIRMESIPEPTALGMVVVAGAMLMRRRRSR